MLDSPASSARRLENARDLLDKARGLFAAPKNRYLILTPDRYFDITINEIAQDGKPMQLHTPAEVETMTGLMAGNQRAWRNNGILQRGIPTAGGHWRFTADDVLWVAAVRAVAGMGHDLAVAAMLVDAFYLDIKGAVIGRTIVHPTAAFGFIWKREDATDEGERAARDMFFTYRRPTNLDQTEATTVFSRGGYCAIRTDHLEIVPLLSRAGGSVVILNDIPRRLPATVTDLFRDSKA